MEDIIMKYAVSYGVFGVAFFYLLKYFIKRMETQIEKGEIREEGYREEIKRGAERETGYQEAIKENQEVIKSQAKSIEAVHEIKTILKLNDKE
ncbi:hypothetical protein COI97_16110 [Bacillus cereus]|nr:hypothetical protein CN446_14805 [Bacillus cereus]PFK01389.1 hypothetical protein COI97_16110 [Bacillus cereus]